MIIAKPIKNVLELQKNQNDCIRSLLRKNILDMVILIDEREVEDEKFIYDDEFSVLRSFFTNYIKLKGNGVVKEMVERVLNLPIKRRETNIKK